MKCTGLQLQRQEAIDQRVDQAGRQFFGRHAGIGTAHGRRRGFSATGCGAAVRRNAWRGNIAHMAAHVFRHGVGA
jgi:hypothetical protein